MHHIHRNLAGDVTRVELEGNRWHVDFERDPLGLELSRTLPNGITSRWERDVVGRPMRRTVTHQGEKVLDDKRYVWDGDDQIRAILDPQHGDAHYKHDARGRLVWGRMPWGEEQHRAMDAVGNIFRTPDLSDRRYGKGGRIEEADGTTYRHDEDGNLVEKTDVLGDTTLYRWNGAGMLDSVLLPDGREVSFEYDVMARRLGKRVEESGEVRKEVRWAWDGANPLREINSQQGACHWVVDPETFSPLAKLSSKNVWGVLTDQLACPTDLLSERGERVWSGERDLLGANVLGHNQTECTWVWPGQQHDGDVGLIYNRYRFLDPSTGRYVSSDPVGIYGGSHSYAYVTDPLRGTDPLGLSEGCGEDISADEIRDINRAPGGSTELTGSADTVIANMMYREGRTAKAAVAIRDIAGRHLFDDANKRTAQAVAERILGDTVAPSTVRRAIDQVATGGLRGIEDIVGALSG